MTDIMTQTTDLQRERFSSFIASVKSMLTTWSKWVKPHHEGMSVRLESGEVGTELQNTLGGGKMQESGNAEGAGKRKCGRSGNAIG